MQSEAARRRRRYPARIRREWCQWVPKMTAHSHLRRGRDGVDWKQEEIETTNCPKDAWLLRCGCQECTVRLPEQDVCVCVSVCRNATLYCSVEEEEEVLQN